MINVLTAHDIFSEWIVTRSQLYALKLLALSTDTFSFGEMGEQLTNEFVEDMTGYQEVGEKFFNVESEYCTGNLGNILTWPEKIRKECQQKWPSNSLKDPICCEAFLCEDNQTFDKDTRLCYDNCNDNQERM